MRKNITKNFLYAVEKSIFFGETHKRFSVGQKRAETLDFRFSRDEMLQNVDRVGR